MAWMMDTYSMHAGYTVPGVVTGKPISLGGSEGRNEATARGTVFCIVEAAGTSAIDLTKATVAVQGFGNAGSIAAQLISEEGATVVAVSDSTGGIHDPDGLDIAKVVGWKQEHGTVQGFPGATDISNAELLEVDCDILIPAALENQITSRNAGNIKARIVAEAANGPTTPEADEILFKGGKFLIPDILCNAGGVTVSYFEWVQDLNRDHWSEAVVNAKLKEIMVRAPPFNDAQVGDRAQTERTLATRIGPRIAWLVGRRRAFDVPIVRDRGGRVPAGGGGAAGALSGASHDPSFTDTSIVRMRPTRSAGWLAPSPSASDAVLPGATQGRPCAARRQDRPSLRHAYGGSDHRAAPPPPPPCSTTKRSSCSRRRSSTCRTRWRSRASSTTSRTC